MRDKLFVLLKEMSKEHRFQAALAVELFIIACCIGGLFGKNAVYEYGLEDMTVRFGCHDGQADGIYADVSQGRTGSMVEFEGIALPAGVYRVCLHYQTDTDMENSCTVSDVSLGYKSLMTNGDLLYAGLDSTDFEMWLLRGTSQLNVQCAYNGRGSLLVGGLSIYETNALNRIILFLAALLFLAVDACIVWRQYDKKYGISTEQKNVSMGLLLLVVFSSLPVLTDYLVAMADSTFHLWRIEGLKEGWLSGQFPVRISAEWLYGYGYAAPVFYGETFLAPAACLRLIGFTIVTSYRYYLIGINAATVLIAYFCFRKILQSRYLGLFGSMLYTLSIYRIHKVYSRGTLGEALALMLLPFLAYGFYMVFTQDVTEKEYRWNWIPLTVGFSGILQSHLLTGEMSGAFTILLCLILWKRVLRRQTFLVLAKTVIYSVLASAWFIVPFADYMLTGDFQIQHASGRMIQERGNYPGHLLLTFFGESGNVFYARTGMYLTDSTGIGIALVAVLGIWLFLRFFGYTDKMGEKERGTGRVLALFSGLAMLLSLNLFPWDRIQFLHPVLATLVSSLEFPDRLLTITNLCAAVLAGIVGRYMLRHEKKSLCCLYFGGILFLVVCSSVYRMNNMLYQSDFSRIYNEEGMGFGYVSSGEYLPYGTDTSRIIFKAPSGDGMENDIENGMENGIKIYSWRRNGISIDVDCMNMAGEGKKLELPLLYYKGYRAYDQNTGEELDLYSGENFAVTVKLPAGYEGTVAVRFQPPWYWRAGEAVSAITLAAMITARLMWKKGRKRHEEPQMEAC